MTIAKSRAPGLASFAASISVPIETDSPILEPIEEGLFRVHQDFTIAGPIRVMAVMTITSFSQGPGQNSTGGWAIRIAGELSVEFRRFLAGSNDTMMGSVAMRTSVIPAGTHAIDGMHRRAEGDRTIVTDACTLVAWAVAV